MVYIYMHKLYIYSTLYNDLCVSNYKKIPVMISKYMYIMYIMYMYCMCRSTGASRDNLKREFEALKETEQELRKKVGRMFRKRRGISIRRITEIFTPTKLERIRQHRSSMKQNWPRRLFSSGDSQPTLTEGQIDEEEAPRQLQGESTQTVPGRRYRSRAQTVALGSLIHHIKSKSDATQESSYEGREDREGHSPSITPSGQTHYSHRA